MQDYNKIAEQQGEYVLTALCKDDLDGHFTDEEIKSLDDNDMRRIAEKMTDAYLENGYWQDLKIATEYVLESK